MNKRTEELENREQIEGLENGLQLFLPYTHPDNKNFGLKMCFNVPKHETDTRDLKRLAFQLDASIGKETAYNNGYANMAGGSASYWKKR